MFTHLKKYSVLMLLILSASLAGCATVDGMGQDVESAGEAVQDAAN